MTNSSPPTSGTPPDQLLSGDELRDHIFATYANLRFGMGVIAIAFPFILVLGGLALASTPPQGSMSAYYHTPMRNAFVGILFALGPFLYLYKGFACRENIALNIAGASAIGVAIFPMDIPDTMDCPTFTFGYGHGVCALLFFACIAYVCSFHATDTLRFITDEKARARYRFAYRWLGRAMFILPFASAVMIWLVQLHVDPGKRLIVLGVECAAVWVFSAYWLLKGWEIRRSQIDRTLF